MPGSLLRRKERLNPRIKIYTYNDIITSIESMKAVIGELQKRGQQDGADQPATAPDSKPEGDEKPKPETEGRSQ